MKSVLVNPPRWMLHPSNPIIRIGALSLFLLFQIPLVAQNDETEGELFVLSPFEVDGSGDVGYRATNTTSGTSLNTAIKELPMTIQVVTGEFMTDIGATDFEEALKYSAGVFTESLEAAGGARSTNANVGGGSNEKSVSSSAGSSRFANSLTLRGFDVPFQTRLGFRVGGIVVTPTTNIALGGLLDAVNIDRMEVVKGPNSLLYGIGVLSGIVNVIPVKPSSVLELKVSANYGDYGFRRATVDATGPIIKTDDNDHAVNFRVAGAWEERGHYTDWQTKELDYQVAQLDYRFRDKIYALFEYQTSLMYIRRNDGSRICWMVVWRKIWNVDRIHT